MNNKRLIILGILIVAISIVGKLLWSALSRVKVDDFKPAAVIFLVDSSASNQKALDGQKRTLRQICNLLDPEDQIKILRVSEDAYLIYEGTPFNNSGISKALDAFTKYDSKDYGTAYGLALKKGFNHALAMQKEGYIPGIVVLGDLENEGAIEKQINWDLLPKNVEKSKQYMPELSMMFLYAHPEKLDMVKEKLTPVLGEKKLIVSPEQNIDKAVRLFIHALGR
ncbi:hypothetical protein DBY21_09875 [Candidatus Gastranaerophilales bacterium]|nr:MAG: hypothetical protein DBY21_09875 [Candidatus Gastranaerophilales bacterium]